MNAKSRSGRFSWFVAAILLVALLAGVAAPAALGQTSPYWIPEPSEDMGWRHSVAAGPYSVVNTGTGSLITRIPLVQLDGPGGTTLDFTLTHVSGPLFYGNFGGQVATGWRHTYNTWIVYSGFTNTCQRNDPGNLLSNWTVDGPSLITSTFPRDIGVRDVLDYDQFGGDFFTVTSKDNRTWALYSDYFAGAGGPWMPLYFSDKRGNKIQITYKGDGLRVQSITDAAGRILTFTWSLTNIYALSSVTLQTPTGLTRTWDFVMTPSNSSTLTEIVFPASDQNHTGAARPRLKLAYDANLNLRSLTDLNGYTWQYTYATVDRVRTTGIYDPYQPTKPVTFNPSIVGGILTCTIKDPLGREAKHIYDTSYYSQTFAFPLLQAIDPKVAGDPDAYSEQFSWDTMAANLSAYTDRRGYSWFFGWDADNWGDLQSITDPFLNVTTLLRDTNHQVVRTITPNGQRALYAYDPASLDPIQTVLDPRTDPNDASFRNPLGASLTGRTTYWGNGNVQSTQTGTDPPMWFQQYDRYGHLSEAIDPIGKTWRASTDSLDTPSTVTDPSPIGITSFTPDFWGRVIKTAQPDGTTTQAAYDNMGNTRQVIDEKGVLTTLEYDVLGRLTRVTRAGLSTSFAYNDVGDLIQVTNPRGYATRYQYDARHLLTQVTYPDNTTRRVHYDANGNVDSRWDGNGRLTRYAYDILNRLTTISYPDGTSVRYTYDASGRRTGMTDATGISRWTYNTADQVTSYTEPVTGKTIFYTYDASGRRKTMTLGAQTWSYEYDGAGQLRRIASTQGPLTLARFDYYDAGLLAYKTLPNQTRAHYEYDRTGQLVRLTHLGLLGTLEMERQRLEYDHDPLGNITTVRHLAPVIGQSWTTRYGYDLQNRLVAETRTGTSNNLTAQYAYDANGNRTSAMRNGVGSFYSVDANDKLLAGDGFQFANYDGNGSPTRVLAPGAGWLTIVYDAENRPSKLLYPSGLANSFGYNGDGLRVWKRDSRGTTAFIYDGSTCIAEASPSGAITAYYTPGIGVLLPRTTGTSLAGGTSGARYLGQRAPSEGAVGKEAGQSGPLTLTALTGIDAGFFVEDGHGSTLGLNDQNGARQSNYLYDAFGVTSTLSQNLGWSTPYQYVGGQGYYTDTDSGMQLLGARFYLPKLGRFLTQDPLGHAAGLNLYNYCDGDPVNNTDPSGSDPRRRGLLDRIGDRVNNFVAWLFTPARWAGEKVWDAWSASTSPTMDYRKQPSMQQAWIDPDLPESVLLNSRIPQAGKEINHYVDTVAVGALMDTTFMGAGKLFHAAGIPTEEHFLRRLASRVGRGVTEEAALRAYNSGRLFFDPVTRNFIRYDNETGVAVVTSRSSGGRAITVFEGNRSPRWVPVPWKPGS